MTGPGGLRAHVIAIGNEILLGDNVDTNSAHISARLAELGIQVTRHIAVSDDIDDMTAALQTAVALADVVVTTGGLGPTQDDMTRVAVARVAGVELLRDDVMAREIEEYFGSRGRHMPANNLQQADLPTGGWWLSRVGTAPGFAIEVGSTYIACLPGVPREMTMMLDSDVVPALSHRGFGAVTVSRTVRTSGLSESGIAETLATLAEDVIADGRATLAFLASRGETRVKLTATALDRPAALAVVDPVIDAVADLLGEGVVGFDDEGVEFDIARRLEGSGLTVAVAESVTGGGVGARLVTVPGASTWFRGGLITYATPTKVSLAGLDAGRLAQDGPVSASTAKALAVAAADRLEADIGLSVVGVAGPDTQGGQRVGTIWIGTVGPDGFPRATDALLPGRGRAEIQEFAAAVALSALHRYVRRLTSG